MLIVTSIPRDAVKTKHTFRGVEVSFDIRPLDAEILEELRAAARVKEFALNPETKKMECVEFTPAGRLDELLYAHIIAGWSGFGRTKDNELDCTLENKLKVMRLKKGPKDKEELASWIIMASAELGMRLHEELEAERKN